MQIFRRVMTRLLGTLQNKKMSNNSTMPLVYLDPGHGGSDWGAIGQNGLRECDVVLDVAQRCAKILERHKVRVMMTRDDGKYISLIQRTNIANKEGANLFVSLHCNAANKLATGIETYHAHASYAGEKLAESVQRQLLASFIDSNDRGVKKAGFHVLRETRMPAILVELEFIDVVKMEERFEDSRSLDLYAKAVAQGILKHLKIKLRQGGCAC